MKKIVLLFLTALIPLVIGATTADAQRYGYGYYRGGAVGFRGGFVGGYPYYAGYAGAYGGGACYRWRIVPTSIGPQWRMVNLCYVPVYAVPAYYGYGPYYY
jgi:hypothetical protein